MRARRDRRRSSRPQPASVSMPTAPVRDALSTIDVDEGERERGRDAAVEHLRLAEPDHADDRPQEQAAQVIRLAQVAGRAADDGGERDPVAVGKRAARTPAAGRSPRSPRRRSPGRCRTPETPAAIGRRAAPTRRPRRRARAERIVPADESASDHGTAAIGAARALIVASASAATSASAPLERGQALRGSDVASTSRNAPQPTNAAAWLKKVADGATLKAMSVGSATAKTAQTIVSASGKRAVAGATLGAWRSAGPISGVSL